MSLYSIIDISSTSISMIIAQETGGEPVVCERDRQYISMLSYLDGPNLSARGIEKASRPFSSTRKKQTASASPIAI
jgi:exopolyphosphatase/pppGpp-phosphohydrolase